VIPWGPEDDDYVYLAKFEGEAVEVVNAADTRPLSVVETLAQRDALNVAAVMALGPPEERDVNPGRDDAVVAAFRIGYMAGVRDVAGDMPGRDPDSP
jgi:hypothetical protein